ncbi:MAG: hypothetical protein FWG54_04955, partial [Bacteroidetes bacterium]|nr:hypothetical protein [Bacteroidota bacterium]
MRKFFSLLTVAGGLLTAGCGFDFDCCLPNIIPNYSGDEFVFDASGEVTALPYALSSIPYWTAQSYTGEGGLVLISLKPNLKADENLDTGELEGTITVMAMNGDKRIFPARQTGGEFSAVLPSTSDFTWDDASAKSLIITTPFAWTITGLPSWAHLALVGSSGAFDPATGKGKGSVELAVTVDNNFFASRDFTLTVACDNGFDSETAFFSQDGLSDALLPDSNDYYPGIGYGGNNWFVLPQLAVDLPNVADDNGFVIPIIQGLGEMGGSIQWAMETGDNAGLVYALPYQAALSLVNDDNPDTVYWP